MKGLVITGAIVVVLLGAALAIRSMIYSPAALNSQKELAAANDKMMKNMMGDAVKYTGDPDLDFVNLMIPHHQGAVEMASTEIRYGKDPRILDLARRIEAAQQPQIDQMEAWRKAHTPVPDHAEEEKAMLMASNDHMMRDMGPAPSNGSPPAKPDKQFIDMMSPHHQGAVDMSAAVLKYGKDPEIRALAIAIDEAQRREIAEMAKLGASEHTHGHAH